MRRFTTRISQLGKTFMSKPTFSSTFTPFRSFTWQTGFRIPKVWTQRLASGSIGLGLAGITLAKQQEKTTRQESPKSVSDTQEATQQTSAENNAAQATKKPLDFPAYCTVAQVRKKTPTSLTLKEALAQLTPEAEEALNAYHVLRVQIKHEQAQILAKAPHLESEDLNQLMEQTVKCEGYEQNSRFHSTRRSLRTMIERYQKLKNDLQEKEKIAAQLKNLIPNDGHRQTLLNTLAHFEKSSTLVAPFSLETDIESHDEQYTKWLKDLAKNKAALTRCICEAHKIKNNHEKSISCDRLFAQTFHSPTSWSEYLESSNRGVEVKPFNLDVQQNNENAPHFHVTMNGKASFSGKAAQGIISKKQEELHKPYSSTSLGLANMILTDLKKLSFIKQDEFEVRIKNLETSLERHF